MNRIKRYCVISGNQIEVNGKTVFSAGQGGMNLMDFLKESYRRFNLDYPRFYKMDDISKLCFMASEMLLNTPETSLKNKYAPNDIGVVIANSGSSSSTDVSFRRTISGKNSCFPSPALFVYTLPNVVIGEICIRNNFKGENAFFIFKDFDRGPEAPAFIANYVNDLLDSGKIKACIAGWNDYFSPEITRSFPALSRRNIALLTLVEKDTAIGDRPDMMEFNSQNLGHIYRSHNGYTR